MTTRLHRLWQPGNPRVKVFLPNFWMKIVKPPEYLTRIPLNMVLFNISPQMTRFDVREYLEKIYEIPVCDVRTYVKQGVIDYSMPDRQFRRAIAKQPDEKFAWVVMSRSSHFQYPDMLSRHGEKSFKQRMQASEMTRPRPATKRRPGRSPDDDSWFDL